MPAALALAVAVIAHGPHAAGQTLRPRPAERFSLVGEVGAGSMEFLAPREASTYAPVAVLAARLNVAVYDVLEAQVAVVNWAPTSGGHDVIGVTVGGRVHRNVRHLGRTWAELNVGFSDVGQSGWEPMFETAAGFEFLALGWLHIGPVFRFAQVFGADFEPDHRMLTAGVTLTLHVPASQPPPPPVMFNGTDVEGGSNHVRLR